MPISGMRLLCSQADPFIRFSNIQGFELSSVGVSQKSQRRPVVLLIGWLNARQDHVYKYKQLYWQRGFDVLSAVVSTSTIVWPRSGIKYTQKLLNVLQEHEQLSNRQVLVHSLSAGIFIYTQLQLLIKRQPHYLLDLSARIIGLVLDSPAYMDYMCHGIANSLTETSVLRTFITRSLLMYLAAFPKSVAFHYGESQRAISDISVPILLLYSAADDISSASTSERFIEEWKQKGVPVYIRKFQDSPHVSHFRQYPQDYTEALDMFLKKLELRGIRMTEMTVAEEM